MIGQKTSCHIKCLCMVAGDFATMSICISKFFALQIGDHRMMEFRLLVDRAYNIVGKANQAAHVRITCVDGLYRDCLVGKELQGLKVAKSCVIYNIQKINGTKNVPRP